MGVRRRAGLLEVRRVSLCLGVFALCSLLIRRRDLFAWCDRIAFGIVAVAVAVLALVSWLFPDTTRFRVFEHDFRAQKTGWIRARLAGGDA